MNGIRVPVCLIGNVSGNMSGNMSGNVKGKLLALGIKCDTLFMAGQSVSETSFPLAARPVLRYICKKKKVRERYG